MVILLNYSMLFSAKLAGKTFVYDLALLGSSTSFFFFPSTSLSGLKSLKSSQLLLCLMLFHDPCKTIWTSK